MVHFFKILKKKFFFHCEKNFLINPDFAKPRRTRFFHFTNTCQECLLRFHLLNRLLCLLKWLLLIARPEARLPSLQTTTIFSMKVLISWLPLSEQKAHLKRVCGNIKQVPWKQFTRLWSDNRRCPLFPRRDAHWAVENLLLESLYRTTATLRAFCW